MKKIIKTSLLITGSLLCLHASWLPVKAWLSEQLIRYSWQQTIDLQQKIKRFEDIKSSPLKKWKFSKVDQNAINLWDSYTEYKNKMFEKTNTKISPWIIIRANRKSIARIEAIEKVLELLPYKTTKNK